MNNISVKKADGTTSVSYVAKRGAGANSPALYSLDAASTIAANRPRITISDRPSAGSKAQKVEVTYTYPVTAVENGVTVVKGSIPITASYTIPYTLGDADIAEATAQFANLLASAELLAAARAGYAPR